MLGSVEVAVDVHPLVQYPNHVEEAGPVEVGQAVVKGVRTYRVPSIADPHLIAGPTDHRILRNSLDRALDFADVLLSLIITPAIAGVVPDLFQIQLGGWRQYKPAHC